MEKRLADLQNKSSKLASIEFDNSYRTDSTFRKDFGKIKKSLPVSPSRGKAMIAKLYRALNSKDREEVAGNANTPKEKTYNGLDPELIKAIREFYQRDDISRVSPNVKDCRKFVNEATGIKEYRQLRYLMYTLNEVHALFIEEYTGGKTIVAFRIVLLQHHC